MVIVFSLFNICLWWMISCLLCYFSSSCGLLVLKAPLIDWHCQKINSASSFACKCRRYIKSQHPKSALLCTLIRISWLILSSVKLVFFVEDLRMASKVIYKWILLPCLRNYATRAPAPRCWLEMQKKL